MAPPIVTALRQVGRGRIAVELDGAAWRVLPAETVLRAGLAVGLPLDRETARLLNRELRRANALSVAVRALRHRDHSRESLTARLENRGVAPTVAYDALDVLERAGLVDDRRTARRRAISLAEHDAGDLLIREDLERRGYAPELVDAALAELEPEAERLGRIVALRGASPRMLRRLAARGFTEESFERHVFDPRIAELDGDELG
jgi:SOS response regulatory protein OraA/RecX